MIHGASGSGHTLFVEPLETIDLNNELVRLREEEMREVHRILRELTDAAARSIRPAISNAVQALGELETAVCESRVCQGLRLLWFLASARTRSASWCLRDARHPLLEDVLRRQGKAWFRSRFRSTRSAARC